MAVTRGWRFLAEQFGPVFFADDGVDYGFAFLGCGGGEFIGGWILGFGWGSGVFGLT